MSNESDSNNNPVIARLAAIKTPVRISYLPVDSRGYPTPKFVDLVNGRPEFRVMNTEYLAKCVTKKQCWVCGKPLGRYMTFVVGPMCIITRTSSEPPSHLECGRYSAQACPFLSDPKRERVVEGMPDGAVQAGIGIKRNPGVVCLWTVSAYKVWRPEVDRGVLFRMSEPSSVEWFARGRPATYQEVDYAMLSGLPLLLELANKDGKDAVRDLEHLYKLARQYMPHEPE